MNIMNKIQTIPVSELRANLMKVLKEIEHGSSLDITSRGRVVAKLMPPDYSRESARKKLDKLGKNAKLHDVMSPINAAWDASHE